MKYNALTYHIPSVILADKIRNTFCKDLKAAIASTKDNVCYIPYHNIYKNYHDFVLVLCLYCHVYADIMPQHRAIKIYVNYSNYQIPHLQKEWEKLHIW